MQYGPPSSSITCICEREFCDTKCVGSSCEISIWIFNQDAKNSWHLILNASLPFTLREFGVTVCRISSVLRILKLVLKTISPGWGFLYEKVRDACRKIWIKTLKKTNLNVAQAFLTPKRYHLKRYKEPVLVDWTRGTGGNRIEPKNGN